MKIISLVLKIIAIVIGLFFIPYGLLGFLGVNPAGVHESIWAKLAGLYMAIIGASYFYPNSKLTRHQTKKTFYYFFTISPVFVVIFFAAITVIKEGWRSFALQGGTITVVGVTFVSLLAPLSLFLYGKQKNHLTSH